MRVHFLYVRLDGEAVHVRIPAGDVRVASQHAKRARFARAVHAQKTKALAFVHRYKLYYLLIAMSRSHLIHFISCSVYKIRDFVHKHLVKSV